MNIPQNPEEKTPSQAFINQNHAGDQIAPQQPHEPQQLVENEKTGQVAVQQPADKKPAAQEFDPNAAQPQAPQLPVPLENLTSKRALIDCPICGHRNITAVDHKASDMSEKYALIGCLLCGLIVAAIVYQMGRYRDVNHICGNCGAHVATYRRKEGKVELTPASRQVLEGPAPAPQPAAQQPVKQEVPDKS